MQSHRYLRASHAAFFLALFATTSAAGCSEVAEPPLIEDAYRVNPTGSDKPGKLLVTTPVGVSPGEVEVRFADQAIVLGVPTEVPVGKHCLEVLVHGRRSIPDVSRDCEVEATSQKTTTYALAAVHLFASERTLLDVTERASLGDLDSRREVRLTPQPLGTTWIYLPGSLVARYGLKDSVTAHLAPGQVLDLDLAAPDDRRRVTFVAPERKLPDAQSCGNTLIRVTQSVTLDLSTSLTVGAAHEEAGAMPYTWRLNGFETAVAFPEPGARSEIAVGRLDVDHVDVELADGSHEPRPGTYRVYRRDSPQDEYRVEGCLGDLPTGTGIDLPPGEYEVRVSYATLEAGTKTVVHRITL